MRFRSFTALLLFCCAFSSPAVAQDGPAARVKAYLAALPKAKSLTQVKPYFSAEFWSHTYAALEDAPAAEQAELLSDTAQSVEGFVVKGETISGNKAKVSVANEKGQVDPMAMVKENGVWVIDMEWRPDDSTEG